MNAGGMDPWEGAGVGVDEELAAMVPQVDVELLQAVFEEEEDDDEGLGQGQEQKPKVA